MNLDQFYSRWNGELPDFDKKFGVQCVDLVAYYAQAIGAPIIYANAAGWWSANNPGYGKVAPNQMQRGDIVVWNSTLPNSGGAGHIAIYWSAAPGGFISFDANWGGKNAKLVTHNFNNVLGGLRKPAPAPAPAQPKGDPPMNPQEEAEAYQIVLERPMEHGGSGRPGIKFIRDAHGELNQKRTAVNQQLHNMSLQINAQNQTITQLQLDIASKEKSGAEKQKALDEALAKLTETTSQLETSHDKIIDEQKTAPATVTVQKTNWFVGLLAALLKKKK